MEERDRITLLNLAEKYPLEDVLGAIGLNVGFQKVVNALYDAVAVAALTYSTASLFARSEGQTRKAQALNEQTNDLNNLVNLLENATDYCVATGSNRPANEDDIIQANAAFSLGEIFKTFCIYYGVGRTLSEFIRTAEALEKHHREISEVAGQSKTLFAQQTSEKHIRKARRLAALLEALYQGRNLYSANQGLAEPLKEEEEELCQTRT